MKTSTLVSSRPQVGVAHVSFTAYWSLSHTLAPGSRARAGRPGSPTSCIRDVSGVRRHRASGLGTGTKEPREVTAVSPSQPEGRHPELAWLRLLLQCSLRCVSVTGSWPVGSGAQELSRGRASCLGAVTAVRDDILLL